MTTTQNTTGAATDCAYIITWNSEPVTALEFDSKGDAVITTGDESDAIRYTRSEALEASLAIGRGADVIYLPSKAEGRE